MGNNIVTRYQNGITNVAQENLFANLRQTDPTLYHQYWNDFDTFLAADWTVTATGSTTQALAAGDGGWVLLTNSAGATDSLEAQKTPGAWTLAVGKRAFFRCRFKVSDATKSALVVGLQLVNTAPQTATDGIYFIKAAAATTIDIVCRKDATTGSTTVTSIATLADDTFIELGWALGSGSKVEFEVNGVVVGSLDATNFFPDATNMAPVLFLKNGEAVAKTMTVDYLYQSQER